LFLERIEGAMTVTLRVIALRKLKPEKGIPHHWNSINRLVREGKFPKPIHIGNRIVFVEAEIDEWLAEQIAKRGGGNESTS
jgi:predicted DNA-binding transcriptional regulator AlpA